MAVVGVAGAQRLAFAHLGAVVLAFPDLQCAGVAGFKLFELASGLGLGGRGLCTAEFGQRQGGGGRGGGGVAATGAPGYGQGSGLRAQGSGLRA